MEENKIMTKTELRKIINFYWAAEEDSHKICGRWFTTTEFYCNYTRVIHDLLVHIFGDHKTDILEEFIFRQTSINFDELCVLLDIKD